MNPARLTVRAVYVFTVVLRTVSRAHTVPRVRRTTCLRGTKGPRCSNLPRDALTMRLLVFSRKPTVFTLVTLLAVANARVLRPEVVLQDVLTRPFAPLEGASQECMRDSKIYLEELGRYEPWALQMYDASAKISPGIITGNRQQMGNYDECLGVKTRHGFVGQACTATVQFEIAEDNGKPRDADMGDLLVNVAIASNATKWTSGSSSVYEWMWCVPSTCNHSEIQEALEIALDPLKVEGRVEMVINVVKESCRTTDTDRVTFDVTDWIYISILVAFALIIIASTSYDIAKRAHLNPLNRKDARRLCSDAVLSSFSVYRNCKSLLNTERRKDSIGCLDGLRYLSICWIIYGHTHYTEVVGVKMNLTQVPRMHHDWSTMLVLNGNIVTDTFFLLSGILLAYTELSKKQIDVKWRFNVIGLYVHRYLRVTPAYAMMIGFYATLFYKFGSGPHWDTWVGSNRDFCRENWWTNLLYVNNYVNVANMCMSQSWYLAADMQLVWLSPIFLYPMLKFARSVFFWIAIALGLCLSVLFPFFTTFSLRLTGTMLYYKEQTDVANVFLYIYTRVYNRFGSYIVGLGMGYLLYKTHSRTIKIPIYYVIGGWLVAITVGLSAVFGPRGMYFETHAYDRIEASFYAGFHRQVFVLAVSWIIFASVHGYAGLLGRFLSWRGWMPLSKLTYSAYLCHYVFLLSGAGSVRTSATLTTMNVVHTFFGNLVLTMFLSALWSLCFEMPFISLDRALLSSKRYRTGLASKSNQAKIFGSMDSEKEIYRPTEETSSTASQTFVSVHQDKLSGDSVYNSAENMSYGREDEESGNARSEVISENKRPSYIYVISSSERNADIVARSNTGIDYVDMNLCSDFNENESSKMNLNDKGFERNYGSIGAGAKSQNSQKDEPMCYTNTLVGS